MKKFLAAGCGSLFADTMMCARFASKAEDGTLISNIMGKELQDILESFAAFVGRYQLTESFDYAKRLQQDFSFFASNEEVHIGLKTLMDLTKSEMEKRLFFSIDPGFDKYYVSTFNVESENIHSTFGAVVDKAFPSAKMDMIEAGNCLATGRNNGAVYHLICTAEIGLRALAWDRRIKAKHNGKDVPLEFAQWGDLIRDIEPEVAKIKKWRSKSLSADATQFYSAALVEVRAFNTGWRTHVMHARSRPYQIDETVALFGHVKRFMTLLATKISENGRTPYVWRKPTDPATALARLA